MRQELSRVEDLLCEERQSREITAETLRKIEGAEHWAYPIWWPSFGKNFGNPIKLPPHLADVQARKLAVEALYERLRHIEVVSVILRFTFPEDFGIISPPVSHILILPPSKDHVSYYLHYLDILRLLRDHSGLPRIADVDMALWTAAHSLRELPAIADLMFRDRFFQEIRLNNILAGLRVIRDISTGGTLEWRQVMGHMLVSRAMLAHDHVLAALICGRSYELLVNMLSERWNIPRGRIKGSGDESEILSRCGKIAQHPDFIRLGYSFGNLKRWRDWRNDAVHPERKINKRHARDFVDEVTIFAERILADWPK